MAGRTRYFFHRVREAFPSANPLSRVMWSLIAIRAGIRLEYAGVGNQPAELSEHESWFRRAYFFRGSLRSLYSGRIQLNALTEVSTEFRELAEARDQWTRFVAQRRLVRKSAQEFEMLRNAFGAHTEKSVADALASADGDRLVGMGFSEDGDLGVEWAAEAYLAAVNHYAAENDTHAMLMRMRDVTLRFVECFNTVLGVYAWRYPVFRR